MRIIIWIFIHIRLCFYVGFILLYFFIQATWKWYYIFNTTPFRRIIQSSLTGKLNLLDNPGENFHTRNAKANEVRPVTHQRVPRTNWVNAKKNNIGNSTATRQIEKVTKIIPHHRPWNRSITSPFFQKFRRNDGVKRNSSKLGPEFRIRRCGDEKLI